jgi:hypothetical protein
VAESIFPWSSKFTSSLVGRGLRPGSVLSGSYLGWLMTVSVRWPTGVLTFSHVQWPCVSPDQASTSTRTTASVDLELLELPRQVSNFKLAPCEVSLLVLNVELCSSPLRPLPV